MGRLNEGITRIVRAEKRHTDLIRGYDQSTVAIDLHITAIKISK